MATRFRKIVQCMAPSGNLFFLLTISELRRQGLTYLSFYALQRTVEELSFSQSWLRRETGLEDYEVSRACTFLVKSGLIEMKQDDSDRRSRVMTSTPRGRKVLSKVLSDAAKRLEGGIPAMARARRVDEAALFFREANRILLGPLQLSIFDTEPENDATAKPIRQNRKRRKRPTNRPPRPKA